ncbi:hypothetical protein YPPY15_2911, partial [Yersinia pestis PY-15]
MLNIIGSSAHLTDCI